MRGVEENTAAGTAINDAADDTDADPVEATDANTGDNLTYTLGGTDMASFDIVRSSGQLETKAKLDYETKKSYMVMVTATDPDGASASIDVTIKVTNVDEEPMIMRRRPGDIRHGKSRLRRGQAGRRGNVQGGGP